MAQEEVISQGVDALIDRLRADGVAAGEAEAEKILDKAKTEAAAIVASAKREADTHLKQARSAADSYRQAGEEALNTAMRDAVLKMKDILTTRFREDVARLVTKAMAEPELLKQMILEIAGENAGAVATGGKSEVILPATVVTQDEIKRNADDIQSGKLTQYVLGLTAEMLREDVDLHVSDDPSEGIRVRVVESDVVLDLTDKAVAALLMEHLQPRFRAVLDGVIR